MKQYFIEIDSFTRPQRLTEKRRQNSRRLGKKPLQSINTPQRSNTTNCTMNDTIVLSNVPSIYDYFIL